MSAFDFYSRPSVSHCMCQHWLRISRKYIRLWAHRQPMAFYVAICEVFQYKLKTITYGKRVIKNAPYYPTFNGGVIRRKIFSHLYKPCENGNRIREKIDSIIPKRQINPSCFRPDLNENINCKWWPHPRPLPTNKRYPVIILIPFLPLEKAVL